MRRTTGSLVGAVVLCGAALALAGCGVVSAMSPQAYLDNLAVKSVNLAAVAPGTYKGDYTLVLPPGVLAKNRHFKVTVVVGPGPAVTVTREEPAHLSAIGASATDDLNGKFDEMTARIETAGAIPVDGVSGATYSSRAFQKAVENAVQEVVP